jgi:hypothetical protein
MHGGIDNPVVGYVTFCAVKLVGYTTAGVALRRVYKSSRQTPIRIGVARTLIGMAVGFALFLFGSALTSVFPDGVFTEIPPWTVYPILFIPLRFAEWWFLIWLLLDRPLAKKSLGWKVVILGTVWSFVLDAPAAFGFFATAGVHIC